MLEWAKESFGYLKQAQGNMQSRNLGLLMKSLNATRDVLQFRYRLRSDLSRERIVYDMNIKSWDREGMVLFLNFTDPPAVSYGDFFDQIEIEVLDPKLFISDRTGKTLHEDDTILQDQIPRQVNPLNFDIDAIELQAKIFVYAVTSIMVLLTIWFLISGVPMTNLWNLIFVL